MMLHFKKFLLQITKAWNETTTELTHKRIMKLFMVVVHAWIVCHTVGNAPWNSGNKFDLNQTRKKKYDILKKGLMKELKIQLFKKLWTTIFDKKYICSK